MSAKPNKLVDDLAWYVVIAPLDTKQSVVGVPQNQMDWFVRSSAELDVPKGLWRGAGEPGFKGRQ